MAEHHSNIITPPDHVHENVTSILIVDADWADVENVALWCKTAAKTYDIYVYQDIMMDVEWLMQSINNVTLIILNMAESSISDVKKKLLSAGNVYYYGVPPFLANPRHLQKPLDWFIDDNK